MKFRKKPVVIEAMQLPQIDQDVTPELIAFLRSGTNVKELRDCRGGVAIHTLEGVRRGEPGDWVIKGVQGELYPCKADIFELTYEAAE